jgi:cytidylate kinase
MPLPSIIAIDGPVASGKSTIGKRLADKLGYLFIDSGIMYRALTYLALRERQPIEDAQAMARLARQTRIEIQPPTVKDGRDNTLLADGQDITWEVRGKEVENNVSLIAAIPEVRRLLTAQLRRMGQRGRVVMVGRDVGTVILPEADCKIFLTASVETRARRRFEESQARQAAGTGELRTYDDILNNLRERDRIDSSRAIAPLRAAPDAVILDTTDLDLNGVLRAIEHVIGV